MARLDICRCPRCEGTEDGTEHLGASWPPILTRAQALQAHVEASLQVEHDAGFHDRGYGEPDDRCPGCQWQRTYDKQRGLI